MLDVLCAFPLSHQHRLTLLESHQQRVLLIGALAVLPLNLVLELLPELGGLELLKKSLAVGVEGVDAVAIVRDDRLEFLLLELVHACL